MRGGLPIIARMTSKLDIINAALTGVGLAEVTLPSASNRWTVLSRHYNQFVAAEIEKGEFEFATYRTQLTGRVTGDFGFNDGWPLPNNVLLVREVFYTVNEKVVPLPDNQDWVQHRGVVYLNATSGVWVRYLSTPDAQHFSPTFIRGITEMLEGVAYRAILRNRGAAQERDQVGRDSLLRAATKASQERSATEPIRRGRLLRRRLSGGVPDIAD